MSSIKKTFICTTVMLVFSTFIGTTKLNAAYMTSLDLIKYCTSNSKEDVKLCYGYIAGVIDYHNLTKSLGTAPTVNFCVPTYIPISKVTLQVMKYLTKSPQHDRFIASPAVALALYQYYPCNKKRKKYPPKPKRKAK